MQKVSAAGFGFALLMVSASAVWAGAPVMLSDTQLDRITAGMDSGSAASTQREANERNAGGRQTSGQNLSFDNPNSREDQQRQANVGASGDGMTGGDSYH